MSHPPPAVEQTVIREAVAADLPRMLELLFQLSQQGALPQRAAEQAGPAHHAMLAAFQADPRATCLVLEVDGRVEGTLTLYILPNLSHGARAAAIVENVVVDADRRGNGYGRMLMAHAEALAGEQGCYKVALTSHRRRTAAHRFYEQIGYTPSHQGFTKYEGGDGRVLGV